MLDEATFEIFLALECGEDKIFTIHRSRCERWDNTSKKIVTVEKEALVSEGIIRKLSSRELPGELLRTSREVIRVEWDRPLYTASSQDRADADFIEWRGSMWRVFDVVPDDCTWRAMAVRSEQKECHDAEPSENGTSAYIVGVGRI